MSGVSVIDMRQYIAQDLRNVSIFANVFAPEVPDDHSRVQGVMDGAGSCHVNLQKLDFCLFRIADSWFSQFRKIQRP
jgi:hypothetical protein